jgi:4-amino-4-deoxy-L-arabinose transferase-like glycosyltransferase
MWAGSIGLLLDYVRQGFPGSLTAFLAAVPFDPLNPAILPFIRIPVVLAAVLTAVFTYLWGKNIVGRSAALLTALFLALDPFLLALTRILGHDGLVTLFMWFSLLAIINYQLTINKNPESRRWPPGPKIQDLKFLLVSGALGGLAFLTKYPSLFLGAFVALTLLIYHWRCRQSWRQMTKRWVLDVAFWSLAAGLVFVMLWPAMWVDPVGRVLAIIDDALRASGAPHQKGSFFFGQPVADPGASFYLIVTLFKTTPVIWLGWLFLLIDFVLDWRRGALKRPWWQVALTLFSFSLLYGLLVTIGGKKQDRYIVPSFPGITALAAMGYAQLIMSNEQLTRRVPHLIASSPLLIALVQAAFVLPYRPYFFTYYNPVLGGGNAAAERVIVGWGEGLDSAAEWLNNRPNAEALNIVAWYSTTFEPYFDGHAIYKIDEEKISRSPKPGLAADYVVLYINQVQRELPSSGALQFFRAVAPVHTVSLHGLDYAWIYPSVKMQHVLSNEARLVGQAELLGFNLLDEDGEPVPSMRLPTDQTAKIQFYWEWQGKQPDEPIRLNLVDFSGRIWGMGIARGTQARFPFEQWNEGMVARDDFDLMILPGTPPGDYYLKAWIDRPDTGERVGEFPLLFEDAQVTLTRPTSPPSLADLNLVAHTDRLVADGIRLVGLGSSEQLDMLWQPGQDRDVALYWQAEQDLATEYPVRLALVDPAGITRATWIDRPTGGLFPTTEWRSGDLIRDPWNLTLPPHVPPGDYRLAVTLGDEEPINLYTLTITGRPRQFDVPPLDLPTNSTYGDVIDLLGLQAATGPGSVIPGVKGQPLTLGLVWQAVNLVDRDYVVTVQLLDGQQQVLAQRDNVPLAGAAPTTSWAAGEVLVDRISLDIPPDVGAGPHQLLIALYHLETGERLRLPNDADHLTIPVVISP